ncbi:iron complex transport system permease protein [Loktanella fryxellensis]|uniref:Iron complex transport system permease protein n=1 Tax=Loktanella fryxellensis TaxID=245187 RepID=A0A1H8HEU3_9RHOB|nr:iron ABC transporter permease [Loktanella fryxellensis]SEN54068.1 iron complex transport system permease protein [Loktanella fryxellensis]
MSVVLLHPARPLACLLADLRRRQVRRGRAVVAGLLALLLALAVLTLCVGQDVTPPGEVLRVLLGQAESFTVTTLRGPRLVLGVLAGLCFGLGGAACQVLLRNALASPDIIGIGAGSGAAAVFGIVVLGLSGGRLILTGIGVAAMLGSVTAWLLLNAPAWSLQDALRWLTGSLNGAQLDQAGPLVAALALCGGALLALSRDIATLSLGDDKASALGVRLGRVRVATILCVVGLVAVATAAVGSIAFVGFLSAPIAARLAGPGRSPLIPAALVGAVLVVGADFAGQVLLPHRYPVGVVTGALGAPFLLGLIVRMNRGGRT